MRAEVLIRPAKPADFAFIRELCCRTAKAGEAIDAARWSFFGEFWVGGYEKLQPEWTYIAEIDGRPVGYLTGCPDTRRFNRLRGLFHHIPLFLRTALGAYSKNSDTRRFMRRFLRLDRAPEDRFPRESIRMLHERFPAHLHMNVESDVRKAGVGRKLVERYRQDLKERGVRGLHLFCGDQPLAFYGRTGFRELGRIELSQDVWVYALGCEI